MAFGGVYHANNDEDKYNKLNKLNERIEHENNHAKDPKSYLDHEQNEALFNVEFNEMIFFGEDIRNYD